MRPHRVADRSRGPAVVGPALGTGSGTTHPAAADARRLCAHRSCRRPAAIPRRRVGSLHADVDRRGEGHAQQRRVDGAVGWHRAAAAHLVARQRDIAAMESRREVPRLSVVARHRRGEEEGRAALAAAASGRRSAEGQRRAWRTRGDSVVARQHAPRVRDERRRPGRRAREDGGLEAQDRAADRDRPVSLQGRPPGLPEALLLAHRRVRSGHPNLHRADLGAGGRRASGVVARRHPDCFLEQARPRRSRPHDQRQSVGDRLGRRCDAATAHQHAGK